MSRTDSQSNEPFSRCSPTAGSSDSSYARSASGPKYMRAIISLSSFETRNGFEKADDLIGAEHSRQLARLAGIGDPFWDRVAAERHAVEETQRADDLIEGRPGDAFRDQMHLIGADVLQPEPIGERVKWRLNSKPRGRMIAGSPGTDCGSSCPRSSGDAEGSSRPSENSCLRGG